MTVVSAVCRANDLVFCPLPARQTLQRRALSEVLPEGGRGHRRREEARQVEFVRVGQALKLDTIVKGDAPTSLATTGLFRRSVRPVLFFPSITVPN